MGYFREATTKAASEIHRVTRRLLRVSDSDRASPYDRISKALASEEQTSGQEEYTYDVALITDVRFSGGTSASNAQEIKIQHRMGMRTAIFHAPSHLLDRRNDFISASLRECLELGYADLVPTAAKVFAPITIVRHPTVALSVQSLPKMLRTEQLVLVINHPARRAGGQIDYDLGVVSRNLDNQFGVQAKLCPISPVIAAACQRPGAEMIPLDELWLNVFDVPPYNRASNALSSHITIGRHSRDHTDKWPGDAQTIRNAYPDDENIKINVLGGAKTPRKLLGSLPNNWTVYRYDEISVNEFLSKIDVYVYFHHEDWVEAFGRAVAEAILRGIPTILPPTFEPLFKDACLYCRPENVLQLIQKLRSNPNWREQVGLNGRRSVIAHFGPEQHSVRLRNLRNPT